MPDSDFTIKCTISKRDFVGIVAPDSSLNRLLFEVVRALELKEGALVEVNIGAQRVAYQVIEGMTREDIVFEKIRSVLYEARQ